MLALCNTFIVCLLLAISVEIIRKLAHKSRAVARVAFRAASVVGVSARRTSAWLAVGSEDDATPDVTNPSKPDAGGRGVEPGAACATGESSGKLAAAVASPEVLFDLTIVDNKNSEMGEATSPGVVGQAVTSRRARSEIDIRPEAHPSGHSAPSNRKLRSVVDFETANPLRVSVSSRMLREGAIAGEHGHVAVAVAADLNDSSSESARDSAKSRRDGVRGDHTPLTVGMAPYKASVLSTSPVLRRISSRRK